ncbi:RNA 2',3'-cyclic phosphodiesterase [Paraglaciecola arctica]|uniref:RNA 2',3'-cyclic phosphodiesterase n=1 Tax=Paraglaciecola arctica BSs20135 TaxID=493475 RepID=K6XIP7_9ALTE|nr:RNA 2',3'-cyclic phosphodiesterase [Paraglaciecola arctica]GAC20529.1 2'-5' RNA ligase [Paraglaciecola arctica BSs20135]
MRAFFGLSPDTKTKLAIEVWRNKAFPKFDAPVAAANFHVTLAFLGQISPKQMDTLSEGVEQISDLHTFNVSLNRVGYWSKPKALWLGCEDTQIEHLQLAKRLHQIANSVGLQLPKQDYVAHLTLARKCASNPPASLIEPIFNWHNAEFHLYESVSGKKGVSYHIRQSWPLAKRFAFKSF